jgi:hypothetical protein
MVRADLIEMIQTYDGFNEEKRAADRTILAEFRREIEENPDVRF